jgi:hypothetical protein
MLTCRYLLSPTSPPISDAISQGCSGDLQRQLMAKKRLADLAAADERASLARARALQERERRSDHEIGNGGGGGGAYSVPLRQR